jgi:NADH-quinone oxidoreductase subunit L
MAEFFDFGSHPGHLYVVATLLPLASFLLLLLAGALRAVLRSHREGPGAGLYHLLGGDNPGRGSAYVATAAIGGAFILSLIGFFHFAGDNVLYGLEGPEEERQELKKEDREKLQEERQAVDARWSGSFEWAAVHPPSEAPAGRGAARESNLPGTVLKLGYRIDTLAVVMFLMVTLVATLIHIFSIGYMGDELQPEVEDHQVHTDHGHLHRRGRFGRFFLFLSLFCFSMLNLILADNLFQVFLSWELVGVCSYLLIGFYYERRSAANAANKAFITNRVGDAGFIIGLLIIWTHVGTFNFDEIFRTIRAPRPVAQGKQEIERGKLVRGDVDDKGGIKVSPGGAYGSEVVLFPSPLEKGADLNQQIKAGRPQTTNRFGSMPYWLLVAAGLGIFLGCVGKSAQFPLHVWLPDAMEGPTPVSALIHAATMVAAGVYLVGRCYPLFTPEALLVIAYTGGITLFVAATIAVVMTDIKKVLAYSTVSQLGYMMLALGVGGWVAGLFHLITHAFFKALLFLCSGSVIYGCHHEQDMTKMGGLYPRMKVTALTMLVGVLAICGLPLFSGWYSKDAIIAQAMGYGLLHPRHLLIFLLPLVTAGLTVFYMFRMWLMTFTGRPRDPHVYEHAHESPRVMTVPLIILAVFSICVAWGWPLHTAETSYLGARSSVHHKGPHGLLAQAEPVAVEAEFEKEHHEAHGYHAAAELLALGVGGLGVLFAFLIYYYRKLNPEDAVAQFPGVHRLLWNKWYFDELYSAVFVRPVLVVAGWCRLFDTKVIDGTVDGAARVTVGVSRESGRFDLGIIDGLVNLTARVFQAVGRGMRTVQTGYLRSYVLFMVLAAVALFVLLLYFASPSPAG